MLCLSILLSVDHSSLLSPPTSINWSPNLSASTQKQKVDSFRGKGVSLIH